MIAIPQVATDRPSAAGKANVLRAEAVAVVVSLVVMALLAAVDIVSNAPAAAPVVQPALAAAPSAGWTALTPLLDNPHDRWAADESARGTRPDAIH